jgi:hypothetical protein
MNSYDKRTVKELDQPGDASCGRVLTGIWASSFENRESLDAIKRVLVRLASQVP